MTNLAKFSSPNLDIDVRLSSSGPEVGISDSCWPENFKDSLETTVDKNLPGLRSIQSTDKTQELKKGSFVFRLYL